MKQFSFINRLRSSTIMFALLACSFFLFSFTANRFAEDFLQQLGITKISADQKITNSILGGYLDQYGLRNAKNIAAGNRSAITKDLMAYTKQYINSVAFQKEYNQLRENNKPKPNTIQNPEEMRTGMIDQYKKSITETEANMKKADASMKNIFEPILVTLRQELKNAEDPNNKMLAGYKKNYGEMLKSLEASNKQQLADWDAKYPANQLLFVKERLKQFMEETSNIDFTAQLIEKNGKKYFVNQAYEHKGNRWKLAYRAGKEVVEPARAIVQNWIEEIK
ncbi:MAG TPA: hypothetical protein VK645_00815 [Chitinophagaceae bacterium]|nr:hypothetical protein [Chitinophagaceae bacterium]